MTLRFKTAEELPKLLRTEDVRRQLAGAAAAAPTGYQPRTAAVPMVADPPVQHATVGGYLVPPHLQDGVARECLAGAHPGPKPRKYRNQVTFVDGIRFDSKLEASCYQWLVLRRSAGEVSWFVRQVPFELPGGVRYRCDFLAVLSAGGVEVLDAKGKDTQAGKNKRKQVRAIYGVDVELWPKRDAA